MTTTSNSAPRKSAHPLLGANVQNNEQYFRALDRALAMRYMHAYREGRIRGEVPPNNPSVHRSPVTLRPRMDIWDDPASSLITATLELPGLKKEDISLRIEQGNLIVWGERCSRLVTNASLSQNANSGGKSETSASSGPAANQVRIPVQELKYGKYQRAIPLPRGTRPSQITANLGEGMLTVTWPRLSPTNPMNSGATSGTNATSSGSEHAVLSLSPAGAAEVALAKMRMDAD